MKKIVVLLICALLIAALAIPALAADEASITITPDKTSAAVGDTITFTVTANSINGVRSLGVVPNFDAKYFELVSGTCDVSGAMLSNFNPSKGLVAVAAAPIDVEGVIGTFTVKVVSECPVAAATVTAKVAADKTNPPANTVSISITGEHSFGAWTPKGDNHAHTCSKCGAEETGAHNWNEGTVTDEPNCTQVGWKDVTCADCAMSASVSIPTNGQHTWNAGEITTEPKCGVAGVKTYTCQHNDEHTRTESVPALEHKYDAVVTAPTCTEKGFTTYTCSLCGNSYVDTYVDATGHKMGEWVVVTDSTCTAVGEERSDCSACDHFETREIPVKAHDYVNAVVIAPTCTEKGYTTRTCVCGASIVDTYVNPTGHKYEGNWQIAVAPTCTVKGEEHDFCANGCGEFKKQSVPATGHTYDDGVITTAPKCEETGVKTFTCVHGDHSYTETVPATGHTPAADAEVTKEPTCTEKGEMSGKCAVCDKVLEKQEIPALGHSWGEWAVTTPATCTAKGVETRECATCHETETKPIDMIDHDRVSTVTAPTCTEQGYTTVTCKNCDYNTVGEYVKATGHTYDDGVITTAPKCEETGVKTFTCVHGDDSYTESVPATGHTPAADAEVTKAPTCEEKGEMSGKCAVCDKVLEKQEIPAIGHDYELTEDVAPTCDEKGHKTYVCKNDATHTKTEEFEALGHTYGNWIEVDEKNHKHVCTVADCGHEEIVAHNWDSGKVIKQPCTEEGLKTYTCKDCAATREEVLPADNKHDYTADAKPIVDEEGKVDKTYHTGICACGEEHKEKHSYDIWGAVIKEPTATTKGEQEKICACGEKTIVKIKANGTLDDEPATGDITGQVVMTGVASFSMLAAAAYVFIRKRTA